MAKKYLNSYFKFVLQSVQSLNLDTFYEPEHSVWLLVVQVWQITIRAVLMKQLFQLKSQKWTSNYHFCFLQQQAKLFTSMFHKILFFSFFFQFCFFRFIYVSGGILNIAIINIVFDSNLALVLVPITDKVPFFFLLFNSLVYFSIFYWIAWKL